jgi:hypothetical protein
VESVKNDAASPIPAIAWTITYAPGNGGGLRIDGPAIPNLLLEVLGKCIVMVASHVVPKPDEKKLVVPVGASALTLLNGRPQ